MAFSKWSQKNNFFFSNSFFLNFEISGDMGKKDFFQCDLKKTCFCVKGIWNITDIWTNDLIKPSFFSKYWHFRRYGQKLFWSQTNVLFRRYEQKTRDLNVIFLEMLIFLYNERSKENYLFLEFWYIRIYGQKTIFSKWSLKNNFFYSKCWYWHWYWIFRISGGIQKLRRVIVGYESIKVEKHLDLATIIGNLSYKEWFFKFVFRAFSFGSSRLTCDTCQCQFNWAWFAIWHLLL